MNQRNNQRTKLLRNDPTKQYCIRLIQKLFYGKSKDKINVRQCVYAARLVWNLQKLKWGMHKGGA